MRLGRIRIPWFAILLCAGVAMMIVGALSWFGEASDYTLIALNAKILCLSCIGIE